MLDLAKRTGEQVANMTSYLEAFYDRQLPKIWGIVEESIGVNREEIKLVTRVLPQCMYFLGIAHGVSQDCYWGINELLGGTGKGNAFSGSVCIDVSFFIFKEMEKKRLGIIIASKSNNKEVQRVAIAFVDGGYFYTSRVESENKMQEIVNFYATMHEATRCKSEKENFMMHSWKWNNKNIVEVPINTKINEKKIKIIEVKNSVKTLGVCETPSLNWRDEFEYVK